MLNEKLWHMTFVKQRIVVSTNVLYACAPSWRPTSHMDAVQFVEDHCMTHDLELR